MRNPQATLRPNSAISAEAAAWFIEFRTEEMGSAARDHFLAWLRQSPQHIQAYLEVCGAWIDLPVRDPDHQIDVADLIARARAEGDVSRLPHAFGAPSQATSATGIRNPMARWAVRFALSAALLAILTLGWALLTPRTQNYVTGVGEQQTFRLSDNSVIELNTRSQVRVRLSRQQRDLNLAAGEALFRVARDPPRPFVVRAGEFEIRAVGTEFDVYRMPAATVVTVLEGRVSVRMTNSSNHATAMPLELAAGEQSILSAGALSAPRAVNTQKATAWVRKQLRFDETPLSEVATELNRYNIRPLVIEGRELQQLRISGLYSSTDPASLLAFLRSQPSLQVTETDTEIRIAKR